ncbi:MAG: hypothetical protein ABSD68_00950 [Candidatus Micrarchaeales archaeon]|jgi:hypothetical protein
MLQREVLDPRVTVTPMREYIGLLKRKEEPYITIAMLFRDEMRDAYEERKRLCLGKLTEDPHLYLNPRFFSGKIRDQIIDDKMTVVNVCRTIWAVLLGSGFEENKDFFTRGSSGKTTYDVVSNQETISAVNNFLSA